ncbi:MAG: amidase domain-containing protein [Clostridia bacterium]|nr:amidase domain-containing protein [Clostridia bacterium]
MQFRETKRSIAVLLAVLMLLALLPCGLPSVSAETREEFPRLSDNCRTMTEERFSAGSRKAPSFPEADDALSRLCFDYFTARERAFYCDAENTSVFFKSLPAADTAAAENRLRAEAIEAFEKRTGTEIIDACTSVFYDEDHVIAGPDGSVALFAYEWTFWDYRRAGGGAVDVSGFGVYHKLTFRPNGNEWTLLADEYDCSDLLGLCTITERTKEELIEMDYQPAEESFESFEASAGNLGKAQEQSGSRYVFYEGYDPDAAAEYADTYVYHGANGDIYSEYYNSAYVNFNAYGGDCANYTSQCIYAGGMPMVYGTAYGTDGWYYRTGTDRSATWTGAVQLRNWMGDNRGVRTAASDSTIYKGSPVFYSGGGNNHAVICVGRNSSGTPIIDSHNNDYYHVVWNYWSAGTSCTTVQLTSEDFSGGGAGGSAITLSDYSYPTAVTQGSSFTLTGIISSNYALESVSVGVYDVSGTPVLYKSIAPYTTTVNIALQIDRYITFGVLSVGVYTYMIEATDVNGYYALLHSSAFCVTPVNPCGSDDPTQYPIPTVNLRTGSSGEGVMWLQACLSQLGYPCEVDGRFGSGTEAVLEQFQGEYGLTADGVAGPRVRNKLLELLTCPTPSVAGVPAENGASVTISYSAGAFTDGCNIYYTADGSVPGQSGSQYQAPFTVTASCTVRAIACKSCRYSSAIASCPISVSDAVFTVTFIDWDGTVIDAQTVPLGGSAVAPPDPEREGWTFIGWDVDFTNVTCDLTVTAQYEQNGSQPALPGDVDCSGAVNVVDALIALRYSMGMVTLDEQGMLNGDMNGDGTVSATDALMILRLAMGRMPAA